MIPNSVANSKEKQLRAAHNKFELAGLPNSPPEAFSIIYLPIDCSCRAEINGQ